MSITRKQFLQSIAWGSGGLAAYSSLGFIGSPVWSGNTLKAIVVDYDRCAGCRSCETACSAWNNKVKLYGEKLNGLGNPADSNIKVWRYNPPVDVPVTCFLCADAPCIDACPVDPHPESGHKALYRENKSAVIQCDHARCIGCESCAYTCETERGGVIFPDEEGHPRHMCTLCNGDPSCVKWCPYQALHFLEITTNMELRKQSPDQIAAVLFERYYELKTNVR